MLEGLQHLVPSLQRQHQLDARFVEPLYPRAGAVRSAPIRRSVTYFADIPLPNPCNASSSGARRAQPGLFFDLEMFRC